jgi:nitrogen fixation protein FixH
MRTKSSDIRLFFRGGGKENRTPAVSIKGKEKEKPESVRKEVKAKAERPVKVEKAKPKKKKRKAEEEDDDFMVSDDREDVLDDGFASDAWEDDGDVVSGGDDLESDRESGELAVSFSIKAS